jgi:hypothetical protein
MSLVLKALLRFEKVKQIEKAVSRAMAGLE